MFPEFSVSTRTTKGFDRAEESLHQCKAIFGGKSDRIFLDELLAGNSERSWANELTLGILPCVGETEIKGVFKRVLTMSVPSWKS